MALAWMEHELVSLPAKIPARDGPTNAREMKKSSRPGLLIILNLVHSRNPTARADRQVKTVVTTKTFIFTADRESKMPSKDPTSAMASDRKISWHGTSREQKIAIPVGR